MSWLKDGLRRNKMDDFDEMMEEILKTERDNAKHWKEDTEEVE